MENGSVALGYVTVIPRTMLHLCTLINSEDYNSVLSNLFQVSVINSAITWNDK